MPTRRCVAYAIRQIRALDPPVEMIAPQHGFLLAGDFMRDVMERLERLPVGVDRLATELDGDFLDAYREVLDELLAVAQHHLGQDEVYRRVESDTACRETPCLHVDEGEIAILSRGIEALPLLIDALAGDQIALCNVLRHTVLAACHARSAPLPDLTPGMESMGQTEWIG